MFHGPLFNVTSANNTFILQRGDNTEGRVNYQIPPGFYKGSCDILSAIYQVLLASVDRGHNGRGVTSLVSRPPVFAYGKVGESSTLRIADPEVNFLVHRSQATSAEEFDAQLYAFRSVTFRSITSPLSMLGYCVDARFNKISINHYDFNTSTEAGFMYSNIVTNSLINQQKSRLLAIVPVKSGPGYNYYEFINPIYNPLAAHTFTDITFMLTDVFGEVLNMDHTHAENELSRGFLYPTIITLHIRKIKS
jgi:hypothetical protein